jgi:transcriptional regulator with XRE-family HTH domain
MSEHLPSIDLEIPEKLKSDRAYRQAFFLAESSALIAKQLIELRKRRGLNQSQVADALETGQPAISRVERADYRNWSFNTLRRLADAMDARLRVLIEPAEDVLPEYELEEREAIGPIGSAADQTTQPRGQQKRHGHFLNDAPSLSAATDEMKAQQILRAMTEEGHGIGIY